MLFVALFQLYFFSDTMTKGFLECLHRFLIIFEKKLRMESFKTIEKGQKKILLPKNHDIILLQRIIVIYNLFKVFFFAYFLICWI